MKYSFATLGCPAWSIERIVEQASQMGYGGVELRTANDGNHIRPEESADSCQAIRKTFAGHKVAIACLMGYTNFAVVSDEDRLKSVKVCESLIQTATQLGCSMVRIFGGDSKEVDQTATIDRVVASLEAVLPRAEASGVKLAFETHDAWTQPANLMAVMRRLPSPSLGICWDIANTSANIPHVQAWQAMGSRVIHVHAKDVAEGTHSAVLPGTGSARIAEGLKLLKDAGYAGWVSLEWEKKWQAAIPEPEVAFPHFIDFAKKIG